ncbi:amino acid permease [Halolamina sp. CBA1230]|uniref:amino acid permease n=1 Tax=Halolamina sp. CBA1230 TaxID=1853690 RepID=UPI0009A23DCA|nr:amino acid permease [Halolamina sp. CBA1230]QKY21390.1 amino acid permease [Halolamina sp. CBA1230]
MVERTRTLGFRVAFALGLGTMIAAGIFSLSGTAVYRIGSSAVIAFVIAALVASITAAAYSEFASIYSENGGGYLFSSRTFEDRDLLTYAIGASLFLGYTGTTAFYLATMDEWFFLFILPESVGSVLPHGSVGIAAAVLLGTLNARGTEESGTFQVVVTAAKVAVLFVFIGGAIQFAGPSQATATFTGGFGSVIGQSTDILSVAALAFITFFGFSAIAASAGEIIDPKNTVPKAIAASIVTVTVLYTFVIIAMVNTPETIAGQPRGEVLQAGETAMGKVAAAFLGPFGQLLIVAGAVFSMVSASNASILAASGIGSLMGRQGDAPRKFSRIHPDYGTPFFSVWSATAVIAGLIFVFITLFGHHGLLGQILVPSFSLDPLSVGLQWAALGLNPLTGFATFNLLIPLSVVNIALIYSRRNDSDLTRGFEMPLVPYLPILGVIANLALVYKLPTLGVIIGIGLTLLVVVAYLLWGGAPEADELVEEAASERQVVGSIGDGGQGHALPSVDDRFTVLVPINRLDRAVDHARLAARIGELHDGTPVVKVLNTVNVPDQADSTAFLDTAEERMRELESDLAEIEGDVSADLLAEGHVSKDVAFDILQTARDDEVDRILMGIPEDNPHITEKVEYEAPCDTLFVGGWGDTPEDLSRVTIGAGGGPHHNALLDLAERLADVGSRIDVVSVEPEGESGMAEDVEPTLAVFDDDEDVHVHTLTGENIAATLVDQAAEHDATLVVGASRTRFLRQWVFGSTTDRAVSLAEERGVPVIVYATAAAGGYRGRIGEALFAPYRYLRKHL